MENQKKINKLGNKILSDLNVKKAKKKSWWDKLIEKFCKK